jgi:hypothetical protein
VKLQKIQKKKEKEKKRKKRRGYSANISLKLPLNCQCPPSNYYKMSISSLRPTKRQK